MKRILMILALLALGCSHGPQPTPTPRPAASAPPAVAVELARAVQRSVSRDVELVGTLAADRTVNVAPEASGRITEVLVDLGDPVVTGQVLFRIRSADQDMQVRVSRAQLEQARASSGLYWPDGKPRDALDVPAVRKARAAMENAHQKYEEYRQLRKEELISDQNLADTRQSYLQARADYETALEQVEQASASVQVSQAQLAMTQRREQDYVVTAPMDGYVQQRGISEGAMASVGQPTNLVLVSRSPLLVTVDVPQRYAARLAVGDPLTLTSEAAPDRPIRARVRRLSPSADSTTRGLPVQGVVESPPEWLRPGMSVKVSLQMEAPVRHVLVPDAAVLTQEGRSSVFVLEPEGKTYLV
ncbi:MAG: efflux RND transporter periplasmic adaptor subunit, partial [Candidatus Eremiobacterota bacterium]